MQKSNPKRTKSVHSPKKALRIFLCVFVITAALLLLTSCSKYGGTSDILSKEELLGNAESGSQKFDYVCEYLDKWNFPLFDIKKVKTVENKFLDSCIYSTDSAKTHAKALAEYFVNNYYDKINLSDPSAVTDCILKAYTKTCADKYAQYYSASEYRDYLNQMSGETTDIGLSAEVKDGKLTVTEVYEQLGAFDAGILPGDVIVSVEGLSVSTSSPSEVYKKLSGEEGTYVGLTIERTSVSENGETSVQTLSVSAQRKPTVSYYLNADPNDFNYDGIGYIKISAFKENTPTLFKQAIDYMTNNGAKGIIFDVRDNRGGYLDVATDMLEYIIPLNKTLVTYKDKDGSKTVIRVMDVHALSIPCAVLCDGNTASAGELFASVLRDYHSMNVIDAYVVGETTRGKGVIQDTFSLSDGSAITLTSANYYPPSDESFNETGVEPSVEVSNTELDIQSAYDRQKAHAEDKVTERIAIYFNKLPKEEFLENLLRKIDKTTEIYPYIAQYFKAWEMPIFDMNKIRAAQEVYMEQIEPPHDIFQHAKNAALLFVNNYYESVTLTDRSKFTDALISSWVESLGDEWAKYRTEDEFIAYESDLQGKQVGLGFTIDKKTHVIINVSANSDSHIKGLKAGDILYKVNGIEFLFDDPKTPILNEDNYQRIAGLLQGGENTSVEITVLRGGEELSYNVVRKVIDTRTITYKIDYYKLVGSTLYSATEDDYDFKLGYIKIAAFKRNTPEQFKEAIDKLEQNGVDGLVFDVRSSAGGTLDAVIDTVSYLVRADLNIVSFRYINGKYREPIKSYGKHSIGKIPCAVLCGESTSSLGELFTAALRDYTDMGEMDVVIIGETTRGKGVLQETKRLYDGSGITLTVAYYYPPLGEDASYNEVGVVPDIISTNSTQQENHAAIQLVKKITANRAAENDQTTDEAS